MSINLKLKKYFIEPVSKYDCFTTCLFEKKKYIRSILVNNKFIKKNLSNNKVDIFIKYFKKMNNCLLNGYYPDNLYLRLYYDKNITKNKKYKDLINLLKKNKKIQLIKYEVNQLFDKLIGTIIRFYTFFDEKSINLEYSICIDSDRFYNKKIIEIFNKFKKTKKLVYGISRLYYSPIHNNDYNNENDYFNFIKLIANCIMVKKDKIFKKEYWDKYFYNMFQQNDLMYVLNYNSFKKYSLHNINKNIFYNNEPYSLFKYGIDELWINFVLKKILIINNFKNKIDVYLCDSYYIYTQKNINIGDNKLDDIIKFLIQIKVYFKYNNIVNKNIFKYFINKCIFLKIKSYTELIKYIDNLIYNFKTMNKQSIKILFFFYNNLQKNKYFDLIYINNDIKYIIYNYKILYKKVQKYLYGEFYKL